MRSCIDCVYWENFSHKQEPVQLGKCKRRAPVVIEIELPGQWPTTEENASCGEWV